MLAWCYLVATGGLTNTRRHRLPAVLSLREQRVAVVAVVCVARADSSFIQTASNDAHARAVLL